MSVSDAEIHAALYAVIPLLRKKLELGIATGGILFKPYWTPAGVRVDLVTQKEYLPINYTNDICNAVACPETMIVGKYAYTRIEQHVYDPIRRTHTITNRCFRSRNSAFLGTECGLDEVEAWADILPVRVYQRVQKPLFAVFQMPDANTIDPDSPLGVSAFADAVDRMKEADEQWERIMWELESSERAIDASEELFRWHKGRPILPKGRERMFRTYEKTPDGKSIFNSFSPEVRDTSYFNAFNQILRRIEDSMGLSYGTFSVVSDVEKTAEEVRASKDRSFSRVQDIQNALQTALEQLVSAMQYYRDTYQNRTSTPASLTCTFGDGVREDPDKEFQRRSQMVSSNWLKPEKFISWYFGCTEEEALAEYIPDRSNDGGLFSGGGY